MGQLIYYVGLGLLAMGLLGGVLTALFSGLAGKRLQKQLESEYGKPRHN